MFFLHQQRALTRCCAISWVDQLECLPDYMSLMHVDLLNSGYFISEVALKLVAALSDILGGFFEGAHQK